MTLKQISSNKCCEGLQKVIEHESTELKCKMKFGIYLPPKAESSRCPVFYWLSGLTCTEQNFITKGGYQQAAAEHGIIVVAPDTSPRGCNIDGEDESWDFGTGAGFYVNATEEPWKANYRMYSYVTEEVTSVLKKRISAFGMLASFILNFHGMTVHGGWGMCPETCQQFFTRKESISGWPLQLNGLPRLINANFPTDPERISISGHSMGGHGALICALKNPGKYKTVSAFAPICNPVQCPWGKKAFSGYLGPDQTKWEAYDATLLVKSYSGAPLDILIDQGNEDQFLAAGQLLPDNFIAACTEQKIPVVFRLQQGYDHSYFFVLTFINDHVKHHAKYLNA